MHDPSVEDISKRCVLYVEQVALHRDALLSEPDVPDIENTLRRYDDIMALLNAGRSQSTIYQYLMDTPEERNAGAECRLRLSSFLSEIGLSREIYDRLALVDVSDVDAVTKDYHGKIIDEFLRNGVALNEAGRQRVRQIKSRIAALEAEFANNLAEFANNLAEDDTTIKVTPEELAGLPQDYIDAREVDGNGLITLFTRDADYTPVMTYADSDDLRRRYMELYMRRAWPENDPVLRQLLSARQELAELLGYQNFAELKLKSRMLGTPAEVEEFIERTDAVARPVAEADYAKLLAKLQELHPEAKRVEPWQEDWLEFKLLRENYNYDPQEARQYFDYDKVRDGLLGLTTDLFGLEIRPWNTPVWHKDVEAFELVEDGKVIGRFYLDSHPRPGKYPSGIQMSPFPGNNEGAAPVALLIQSATDGLLEHGEVVTFFHEFGHVLHFLFSNSMEWAGTGSDSVQRDFIEAPAFVLENWVYEYDALSKFATNEEGKVIPRDLVDRMNSVRKFNRGASFEMWLLARSAISHNFHTRPIPDDLGTASRNWRQDFSLFPVLETEERQASFIHLGNPDYCATYYTYSWSRVIAADIFSRFRAEGLTNRKTAEDYRRMVLEPGATRPAGELVSNFLGREISFESFRKELERGLD